MALIKQEDAIGAVEHIMRRDKLYLPLNYKERRKALANAITMIKKCQSADAETDGDMGEVSDGYHTFNQLYHQRAVLFATIVKQNKEKAWKSWKHGDGKFCFDSNKEWFIVGVDTPEGSYTYHYEKKYWDMFDCIELEHGKFWDGHTEEDVTRLLSIPSAEAEWIPCSERLPDIGNRCLVTLSNNVVAIGTLHNEDDKRWHLEPASMMIAYPEDSVTAWMPLPEPYKAESEEV